jgi:hypothetical protein
LNVVVNYRHNSPESEDTETSNHGSAGESTLALSVDIAEGSEDVFRVGASLAELLESVGEDVEAIGTYQLSSFE